MTVAIDAEQHSHEQRGHLLAAMSTAAAFGSSLDGDQNHSLQARDIEE